MIILFEIVDISFFQVLTEIIVSKNMEEFYKII